ncbi:hypothetical protein HDU87_000019 [Geranomyces variabilis]|uniref:Acyltransferase 3 domain-containing protein n=1 Tax=Geranomyces variabilis TaxID=109894 RepID=A0AAD5TRL2_9FUNG|nr:hypothetical protein HDU87_000019 [Geranomyces variabilis]
MFPASVETTLDRPTPPAAFRIGYVDLLRMLAAIIVMNGNFAKATIDNTTKSMPLDTPWGILRDTNWAIVLLFMISGRVVAAAALPPPAAASGGAPVPDYPHLVSSMFRRAFRFALPVIVVSFTQWMLCAKGHTSYASGAAQQEFNGSPAMIAGPAGWCTINNFSGLLAFIVNLFTHNPVEPSSTPLRSQTQGSMLWTTTWAMWGSYTVYLTAFLTAQLASNRYVIFAVLCAFSWVTYSYAWVFLLGYIIHDLSVHGHLGRPRSTLVAIVLQISCLAIAALVVWIGPLRDGLRRGFRNIQIDQIAHNDMISFPDTVSVFFFLMFFELSPRTQQFMSKTLFKHLGRLAAGVFVLHPIFLYTVIPRLAVTFHGTGAAAVAGVCWIVLFVLSLAAALVFFQLVEKPSVLLGRLVWSLLAKPVDDGTQAGNAVKGDRYALVAESNAAAGKGSGGGGQSQRMASAAPAAGPSSSYPSEATSSALASSGTGRKRVSASDMRNGGGVPPAVVEVLPVGPGVANTA